jgi:hypothetical protein
MEFQEISLRMQKNCQTIKAANNWSILIFLRIWE